MPQDMKNLIIRGLQKDEGGIILKDNTPKGFQTIDDEGERYATLSWGLFDEVHEPKDVERYGRALFDTKTRKIIALTEVDSLYNRYPMDIGVFAMAVDPLTSSYPWNSPYAFAENDVVRCIDVEGLEKHVVITIGSDIKYRGENISKLQTNLDIVTYHIPSTEGIYENLDKILTGVSSSDPNGILSLIVWSHGSGRSIFANHTLPEALKNKLTKDQVGVFAKGQYAKGAFIYLGGCNSGTPWKIYMKKSGEIVKEESYAQSVSDVTNVNVISADSQIGPNDESLGNFEYIASDSDANFYKYIPNKMKQNLGRTLDVYKEMVKAQREFNSIKKMEPIKITEILLN
jgi:hypothetical protein